MIVQKIIWRARDGQAMTEQRAIDASNHAMPEKSEP